jgi:hypothetical protein
MNTKLISIKRLIFLMVLMIQNHYFAQNDTFKLIKTDTVNVFLEDWTYTLNGGEIIYCGLPSDDEQAFYNFKKIDDSDSLVFCKRIEKNNKYFSTGCYRLIVIESNKLCWISDGLWSFFNENGELVRQEVFHNRHHYELDNLKSFKVFIESLED